MSSKSEDGKTSNGNKHTVTTPPNSAAAVKTTPGNLSAPSAKSGSGHGNTPPLQSCTHCRKRKIRCDKAFPSCSQCLRASTPCTYPASQRKGRPRTGISSSQTHSLTREEQLLRRIRRLETVIESLKGGDPNVDTSYVGEDWLLRGMKLSPTGSY